MNRPNAPRCSEPAHSLLYAPDKLRPPADLPDVSALLREVERSLVYPFNCQQAKAFERSFTNRITLLWGPPGTGKTTVLAGIVLGWLERAEVDGVPVCIGIGSSNWKAIDNVLVEVAELVERRREQVGPFALQLCVARVRGDHSPVPEDPRIEDVERRAGRAAVLVQQLDSPGCSLVIGGTSTQLSKLAKSHGSLAAPWFDLVLIDEASQVPVTTAALYFLLAQGDANIVLAGDPKQLGPIYGFPMQDTHAGLFDCIFTYMQQTHSITPVALDQNYRTNEEISAWPRKRFYPGGYEACNPQRRLAVDFERVTEYQPEDWPIQLPWSPEFRRILDPALPVTVVTYRGSAYTLSNPFEAQMVAALSLLYWRALREGGQKLNDDLFSNQYLGIVTPHRAQAATVRNLLNTALGIHVNPRLFVDTVDRFQGQERDLMLVSYAVADVDFVGSEAEFILDPRRFNVTLTRARSKFVMFVSEAILQYLPADSQVARDAAHLQLFVEDYCSTVDEELYLPFFEGSNTTMRSCRLRGQTFNTHGA